jgi:hypothetical protein
MKCFLLLLAAFYGVSAGNAIPVFTGDGSGASDSYQMGPVYFVNRVPLKVGILEKIDLTFMKSSLITECRYMLHIPGKGTSIIDRGLLVWSAWQSEDIVRVVIPQLDQAGEYKFIVEYKTRTGSETKRFEKQFTVTGIASGSKPANVTGTPPRQVDKVPEATGQKDIAVPESKTEPSANANEVNNALKTEKKPARQASGATVAPNNSTTPPGDKRRALPGRKTKIEMPAAAETAPLLAAVLKVFHDSAPRAFSINRNPLTQEKIVSTTINSDKDPASGNPSTVDTVRDQMTINEAGNNGNTSLHQAILSGDERSAVILLDKGADPDIRNDLGLSSLHLAVLRNNRAIVSLLLKKGANVNLTGNSGYSPLHIASELNGLEIARLLLLGGADKKTRTNQGFSAGTIAKLQGNREMARLIAAKHPGTASIGSVRDISLAGNNPAGINPELNFSLPFDNSLVRKRRSSRAMEFISVPVCIIGAAGFAWLRTEADHNFSLSHVAETETMARSYFNKGTRLDRLSYASGGISVVSAFSFIHSAIRKKNISVKMHKTFNK